MLEGLSRFLIEHERCGAGFDVAHPAGVGSGRVSITCRGCGASHEYLTSTIEIEREVQFQVQSAPEPAVGAKATAPKVAAAAPPEAPAETPAISRQPAFKPQPQAGQSSSPPGPPSSPPKAPSGGGPERPSSAPPAAPGGESGRGITGARAGTIALLAVAVIAVVVALLRLSGGSNDDNAQNSAAPSGGNQPPATTPQQPAQPQEPQQPQQPQQPAEPSVLRRVTTPTYTLDVPADWTVNSSGPALRVAPPDSDAVVLRVYSDQRPDLSLADMGRLSGQLLQRDHPGSSLSSVHATKVGGIDAATVGVDFDGGSETAFAIARGADRYLLLVAVGKDASATERRQMATVVSSFQPA